MLTRPQPHKAEAATHEAEATTHEAKGSLGRVHDSEGITILLYISMKISS